MKRLWLLIGLTTVLAGIAQAEPQYTALFGQSCFLCHTNATGRGMRSLYGSQFFAPTYLPVKPVSFELLEKIKPQLSESVIIGADLRTIWLSENTQDKTVEAGLSAPLSTNTGTMSQMEGYLYLSLQPSDHFLIYYSQGIAQSGGRFEMYGMTEGLPVHSFIKAGQFQENYGWALADHTSFVRAGLFSGLDSRTPAHDGTLYSEPVPPHYGVGAEIGVRPYWFDASLSFTNAQVSYPLPNDTQKRWFARVAAQRGIEKLKLQFAAGGSYIAAPRLENDLSAAVRGIEAWGGFGSIGWQGLEGQLGCKNGFGFLATSLLFEYDRKAWEPAFAGGAVTSAYSTGQLSVMAQPGVWLVGQYDWMDNGSVREEVNSSLNRNPEAERTTLGIQVFPLPWVEVSPRYRLYSLAGDSRRNKQQWEVQAHFFF